MTSAQQQFERAAAARRLGQAVAALVIAQHAEFAAQRRRLRVRHVQIGGQRIGEDQPRFALGTARFRN